MHPNVVGFREAFYDQNTLTIVMEYANSGDLLQMIQTRRHHQLYFKESQAWRMLIEAVSGL